MNGQRREDMVTVAIDKDKGSQYALKWAVDHLLGKGKIVTLLHVKQRPSSIPTSMGNHVALSDVSDEVAKAYKDQVDNQAKELFLPFRCFCTRKDIQVNEVLLEDMDVAKAICEYVKVSLIENLVVGATSRNGFVRTFKTIDVPGSISKGAPEFCTVHVISKGKIASVRSASIPVPNQPTVGLLQKHSTPFPVKLMWVSCKATPQEVCFSYPFSKLVSTFGFVSLLKKASLIPFQQLEHLRGHHWLIVT
ncbi:unnamed protein product [Ilex paraguariensis]|uniref:RING-type E3 ubiquitin transferase n=1 Tax=Ilex paraguariensis TaxID=185542 RepID=A0ABC8TCD3_9AQUA